MKAQLKIITLAAAALCFSACDSTGDSDQKSFTSSQIKDTMTAQEFREYGKTSPTIVSTRMGDLEFTEGGFAGGYPTLATIKKLRDELDYQRATQAYIWAMPLVSYAEWLKVHEQTFNAKDGDIILYKSPRAKQGILTANVTTPYAISFADLTRTGPLVFVVPPGPSNAINLSIIQPSYKQWNVFLDAFSDADELEQNFFLVSQHSPLQPGFL